MGEILEHIFNSVIDKLKLYTQDSNNFCLLIFWLPNDCQVTAMWQLCQYYWCLSINRRNEGDP